MSKDFNFNTQLDYPIGLKGEVLFNEEAIQAICQLVGVESLTITSSKGKPVITIKQLNSDGTATAGKSNYFPESSSSLKTFDVNQFLRLASFRFSEADIQVNLEKIKDELLDSGKDYAQIRDPDLWAKKLNNILKKELFNLILLKQKSNYQISVKSWMDNREDSSTYFDYQSEIRKLIYTTNIIEGYYRQVRKVIKTKVAFLKIDSVEKMLYMVNRYIARKWSMPIRDWDRC